MLLLCSRYLRLTKDNIEELEEQIREEGKDPGIHAHMTEEQVLEYFDRLDGADAESEEEMQMEDI